MISQPTTDKLFWAIVPVTEAQCYGKALCRPWCGKLRDISNVNRRAKLCQFDKETGQLDDNTNASATLSFTELYETELEAWEAYVDEVDKAMLQFSKERGVAAKRIADGRREEAAQHGEMQGVPEEG